MTRPIEDVRRVLELSDSGLNHLQIANATNIPRSCVIEWLRDALPDRESFIARRAAILKGGSEKYLQKNADWSACAEPCPEINQLDPKTYSYLLGVYLGDGYISWGKGRYRLRIACCDAYPKIMNEIAEAIESVCRKSSHRVQCEGCTEVGVHWIHWSCVFPQVGPGRKHERNLSFTLWQLQIVRGHPEQLLRGLIQTDGCRPMNRIKHRRNGTLTHYEYVRYNFTNNSDDIRGLFCYACDLLNIHWTQMNSKNVSVSRKEDVQRLDTFIGAKR